MKKIVMALMFTLLLIFGVAFTGCGGACTNEDSSACSTTYSTCTAGCIANKACLDKCQVNFCDCMDSAGCEPSSNCKNN